MASKVLDTYLHGVLAGQLVDDEGRLSFAYDTEYMARENPPVLSVSLPLRKEPYADDEARPFFSGLLPDADMRERLERVLHVSQTDDFGLLEAIGGECAGAVSLVKEGEPLPTGEAGGIRPLTDESLADAIDSVRLAPLLADRRELRYSLAGAQPKFPVCLSNGRVALPFGGLPSTHILKPTSNVANGSVVNEYFCMRLAGMVGLTTVVVKCSKVGKHNYFVIERFDRKVGSGGKVTRVHQEDFCQALGRMPDSKYESMGGPGIADCLGLIKRNCVAPARDALRFLRMVAFNYLVGNADAHAKNYALLYKGTVPSLAPIYDVLCISVWNQYSTNLSMAISGEFNPFKVGLKHWESMLAEYGIAPAFFIEELGKMAYKLQTGSEELRKEIEESGTWHPIMDTVQKEIYKRTKRVLGQLEKAGG